MQKPEELGKGLVVKMALILMLERGEDKRRLCSGTDCGIQHDPNRSGEPALSKGFLDSPKAPKTLSVTKGRNCKLRIWEAFKAQIR